MQSEKYIKSNTMLWAYLAIGLTVLKPALRCPLERCGIQSITPGQGSGSVLRAVSVVLRQNLVLEDGSRAGGQRMSGKESHAGKEKRSNFDHNVLLCRKRM